MLPYALRKKDLKSFIFISPLKTESMTEQQEHFTLCAASSGSGGFI
jgi:hypothetical protein